jgi:hypothetical protein
MTFNKEFWKIKNASELFGFIASIVTIFTIVFAIISIRQANKSLRLTKESNIRSDYRDSINRIKDSISFIADTTYKNEVKRLQTKQQILLDTLVRLTDTMIQEKIYSERPNLSFILDTLILKEMNDNEDYQYGFIAYNVRNIGKRTAYNFKSKQYFYSWDSKNFSTLKSDVYPKIISNPNIVNPYSSKFKIYKHPIQKENDVFAIYILNWYDRDLKYTFSDSLYFHFTLINGSYIGRILNSEHISILEKIIKTHKKINLNEDLSFVNNASAIFQDEDRLMMKKFHK